MSRNRKVSYEDQIKIAQLHKEGTKAKDIATRFGVSTTIIYRVINAKNYEEQLALEKQAIIKVREESEVHGCAGCGCPVEAKYCLICAARNTANRLRT